MFFTLLVFHFEISGKDINDEQRENKSLIFVTLLVFHFEISGKDINDEQFEKIPAILVILIVLLQFSQTVTLY